MTEGGSMFQMDAIDISPLVETVSANAPMIVTAGVTITLVVAAVRLIPRLIKGVTKG